MSLVFGLFCCAAYTNLALMVGVSGLSISSGGFVVSGLRPVSALSRTACQFTASQSSALTRARSLPRARKGRSLTLLGLNCMLARIRPSWASGRLQMTRQVQDPGHGNFPCINKMQTLDSGIYVPSGPIKRPATFDLEEHISQAWQKWKEIGSPRYIMAPMVDQSELVRAIQPNIYSIQ